MSDADPVAAANQWQAQQSRIPFNLLQQFRIRHESAVSS